MRACPACRTARTVRLDPTEETVFMTIAIEPDAVRALSEFPRACRGTLIS
jgi:hypothetical protein